MKKGIISKLLTALLVVGLLFSILPSQQAQAATLCVNPGGTEGCYSTIQAAIDVAQTGDVISVAEGTYVGDLLLTKPITLQGVGDTTIIQGDIRYQSATLIPGTMTLKDLQVVDSAGAFRMGAGTVGAFDKVVIDNVTMSENLDKTARAISFDADGDTLTLNSLTVKNSRIHSTLAVYLTGKVGEIDIQKNDFYVTNIHWGAYNAININQYPGVPAGVYSITDNRIHVPDTAYVHATAITNQGLGGLANQYGGKELIATGNTIQVGTGTADGDQSTFINDKVAQTNALYTVINQTKGTGYTTIQAAIDAADAGDRITVAEGTYNEALTVNKPLSLVGAEAAGTIIDGTGLTQSTLFHASGFSSGTLEISDFTFKDDPDANSAMTYLVSFSGISAPATIDFHNNTLIGTGVTKKDWGLLAQGLDSAIVINNNFFDNIAGNSIMLERALGAVEVGHNTFKVPNGNGAAIWAMSYGTEADPHNVIGKQWYHDNHIFPKTEGGNILSGITIAPAWGAGWNVRQYGSFEDVLVKDNIVEGFISVGIQVEVDGMNSSLANGVIQNNSLTAFPGELNSKGIRLLGNVTNTQLIGNNISAGQRGIYLTGTWGQPVYPVGITIEGNNLADNVIGYDEIDTANNQDISPNWWGAATGPAAGYVVGNTNFIPWCTDAACTKFGGPVTNITQNKGYATIQAAINAADAGNIIVPGPGTYTEDLTIDKAITLQGPGFVETFDDPITLGPNSNVVDGAWYVDRKAPAVFESGTFQGESVLHQGISTTEHGEDGFNNYQGRVYHTGLTGSTQTVTIDLFVGEDWNTEDRVAGIWTEVLNSAGVKDYPLISWRGSSTITPGFYAYYDDATSWVPLRATTAADFGKWHTLEIELTVGTGIKFYVDGQLEYTVSAPDALTTETAILNAFNFGADYDIYWDNFGAHDARINGEINIQASGVNLNGLMLSNPGDTQAVVIHSTANGVNLSENLILEVGGKAYNQKVQAVYLQGGPDQVKFEDNLFTRIHASEKSANGIFSGDTLTTDPAEGLIIKNNRFVNITSATKGAYGILLNNAAGNPAAVIEGNLFTGVAGGWTHAIGMEGPTEGAKIEKNIFNELAYGDEHAAIFFEANPGYGTTQIISNQFLSKEYFSVAVHTGMGEVEPIDVARNWWRKTTGPEFPLQLNDPAKFVYNPWCLDAACTLFSAEPKVGFELTDIAGACSIVEKTIEIKATDLVNLSAYRMAFEYNQNLVEIVKVENVSGLEGVVMTDANDTENGKYVFEFYRRNDVGNPISGDASLIKITYKSKQLAGDAEFTLDAANSMLVQWPNVNPMPVTVSNPTTKVTYPLVATNTSRNPNVGYCTLPAAIEAAASGETVRAEISVAIPPQTIEKELTLNTNGMTISQSGAGSTFITVKNGGKLTLTGAGTISTTINTAILVQGSLGNETVLTNNDVTILGPYFSVAVNANRVFGGTENYPAKYIMLGGKTQDTVIAQGKGAELDLRGGQMFGVAPVMGNGTVSEEENTDNSGTIIRVSGTVEIDGTTINPLSPGIFHPQYGDLYISGGTIKGYNGVEMKAGNLTMTGGKIQGVGAYVESPEKTGNGSTKAGDGLFVYSRNGYSKNNLMNINISGGEISSTNAYAIREFNHSDEANRIDKFSISGGTFLGNEDLEAVLFTVADPDHDKLALTAGAYSSNPAIYVYSPLATYLDTDNLYRITTQPTITAEPFAAYYLTVDENAFKATLTNPAGAASYAKAMVKLTIPGATLADVAKIQFIEPEGLKNIIWKEVGTDLVGWYGGVADGGVTLPAGVSVPRDITIKFNEAGIYTLKGELYQMDGTIATDGDYAGHAISKLTEASFSVTVYNKPVITTDLVGPYHAGEAANVTINVNNVDAIFAPDKTELHLDLPEGTIVVYDSVEYVCTATGCVIPVTLAAGDNALAVKITFPGAFEDEITIGLFDKSVIPGKQLATFETPAVVSVYGNVATFTGTVSMQGQLTNRKNVPMTLTGPDAFGFGPYNASSDSRGKLTFTNLPVGSYFVTTAQPRYLNLYIGTLPTEQWIVDLNTLTSLPELWLRGGNAVWTDNFIDYKDANRVGSDWGATVTSTTDGDVNFDGIVNIQDIALVGGNYDLTSAIAYADWLK